MNKLVRPVAWMTITAALAFVTGFLGCSRGGQAVAPVKGKVVFEGQPIKGGSITFRPVSVAGAESGMMGKPASAEVGQDGTFVLSTYATGDGAVIGKHQVMYTPMSQAAESSDAHAEGPAPSPYAGLVPKNADVEVKAGSNDIEIELVKPASSTSDSPTG